MVREIQYTNIRRVLDNLKDDPNMVDLTLEQVVRHTLRFMEKFGFPKFYHDQIEDVEIHEFRGMLPCDLISIDMVKEPISGICLRSMTDKFTPGLRKRENAIPFNERRPEKPKDLLNNVRPIDAGYIPPRVEHLGELTFKTQGRVIYTSFPEGVVTVAYKAIMVDEDGFPLLIDNEVYLDALEAYIALRVYQTKFRSGKITPQVYQDVQQSYAVAARLLQTEFTTPSYAEAESYTRYFNSLIPRVREFDNGFKHLGDREYIRRH